MKIWLDLDIGILIDDSELVFERLDDNLKTIEYSQYILIGKHQLEYRLRNPESFIKNNLEKISVNGIDFCGYE